MRNANENLSSYNFRKINVPFSCFMRKFESHSYGYSFRSGRGLLPYTITTVCCIYTL